VAPLVFLAGLGAAEAGTFVAKSVNYDGWPNNHLYQAVIVEGSARYEGPLDIEDQQWLIQTFLNNSDNGSLDVWNPAQTSGAGANGNTITAGMVVWCTNSSGCAATGGVRRTPCGSATPPVRYKGRTGVAIYHQGSPEIHALIGDTKAADCYYDVPPPPGSDPEDPPDSNNCTDNCEPTPILIDVNRDGLALTGVTETVWFDLDADGVLEQTTWTAPGTEDAFLVLDRNGNGRIDDGRELFGSATHQPAAAEPNGFAALGEYDRVENGGDGDGAISPADMVFPSLQLWADRNQDGVSQSDELSPLASSGVEIVELRTVESGRRDRYGNRYRWASRVTYDDGHRRYAAIDVIFVTP
jgi:hypothetical protein